MVVMMRVHPREHRRKRRIPRHLLVAAPDERGNGVQSAGPFGARQNSFCCVTHGNDLGDIARKIKPRAARGDPAVWPGSPEIRRSYRSAPPLVASTNGRRARMECRPFRSRRFCRRPIDDSAASAPRPQNRSPAIFASVARAGTKEHIRHESSCSSTTRSPCGNGTTPLAQESGLCCKKSREVQAFSRFSATRLRNWMRREVSSTMTPDCTNCVNVRDTVSMVSPR